MGDIIDFTKKAKEMREEEYRKEIQRRNAQLQRGNIQPVRSASSQKRNIYNRPTTVKGKSYRGKKANRILVAGISALIFFGAMAGIASKGNDSKQQEPTQTITYTITNPHANKEELQTIDDVREDFKKQYLKAYNEVYDTNYYSADMYVNYLAGDAVYKLEDGRPVTRGSHPYETEKALKQIGEFKATKGYSMLLQIVSEDGKILGSYNTSTGEFVYSGNQLEDLTNANFNEPTLEKLGISEKMVKTAADVVTSEGQRKESIKTYINRYKDAKEENNKPISKDDGEER